MPLNLIQEQKLWTSVLVHVLTARCGLWLPYLSWDRTPDKDRKNHCGVCPAQNTVRQRLLNKWVDKLYLSSISKGPLQSRKGAYVCYQRERNCLNISTNKYFLPPERLQGGNRAGPGRLHCRLYTGTVSLRPTAVCSYLNLQVEPRGREAGPLHGWIWMISGNSNREKPTCF